MSVRWIFAFGLATFSGSSSPTSLRFFGNGVGDFDRVKIRLDAPARPIDVGQTDFTIEWWMMALPGDNLAQTFQGGDGWIYGNILIDRDVYGPGDFGDFGVSLGDGRVTFGCATTAFGHTIVGSRPVDDGLWHHVAVQRRLNGDMTVYVDGVLDSFGFTAAGNASYRNGRNTPWPNDPYLVLGAEKHDAGPEYPSYRGWLDEMRVSKRIRYSGPFRRPRLKFVTDADTVALFHFDEGTGPVLRDSSGQPDGPSDGQIMTGGNPIGPVWSLLGAPVMKLSGPGIRR